MRGVRGWGKVYMASLLSTQGEQLKVKLSCCETTHSEQKSKPQHQLTGREEVLLTWSTQRPLS